MKSYLLFIVKIAISWWFLLGLQMLPEAMAQPQVAEHLTKKSADPTMAKAPQKNVKASVEVPKTKAVKPSTNNQTKAVKPGVPKNKTFIPSEHISEDLSVSFPIDI